MRLRQGCPHQSDSAVLSPAPSTPDQNSTRRLFLWWRWRIVLQQLRHGLCQILLLLVWLGFGIDRLTGDASPHQIVILAVIHVERQLTDINRRCLTCCHSTPATVPTASIPART